MRTRILIVLACLVLVATTLPFQGCGDNDNSVALPCCPICSDGVCTEDEDSCNCGRDCGFGCAAFPGVCGDGVCGAAETHERCAGDCPLDCRQCVPPFQVYVDGQIAPGYACPPTTTEAYRRNGYLVCSSCVTDRDCGLLRCIAHCGPDANEDEGSCLPVRECAP